jgi:hypothetical protein
MAGEVGQHAGSLGVRVLHLPCNAFVSHVMLMRLKRRGPFIQGRTSRVS